MSEKLAPAFIVFLTFSLVIAQVKYHRMISIISAIYYRFTESVSNSKSASLRITATGFEPVSHGSSKHVLIYTKLQLLYVLMKTIFRFLSTINQPCAELNGKYNRPKAILKDFVNLYYLTITLLPLTATINFILLPLTINFIL